MDEALVITTSRGLIPPFYGWNRKLHDLVLTLQDQMPLVIVSYENKSTALQEIYEHWGKNAFEPHVIQPITKSANLKAIVRGTLRTVVERNENAEYQIVRNVMHRYANAKLLIDDVHGASLAHHFRAGVIISCNDCGSDFVRQEMQLNPKLTEKLRGILRYRGFINIERNLLHLADALHVVKKEDGNRLMQINPRIKPVVIPLASSGPSQAISNEQKSSNRSRVLIWGNLDLGLISSGYLNLLKAHAFQKLIETVRITVLGRVSRDQFSALIGDYSDRFEYVERAEDIDSFINQFDVIVLPDTAGSGQKFRLLDSMRLGKCVIGYQHPFEGLPSNTAQYYIAANSNEELAAKIWTVLDSPIIVAEIGAEAKSVFESNFSLNAFKLKWLNLIRNISALQVEN